MATESVALETLTRSDRAWFPADEFVLGAPATRLQALRDQIVSFFDLFQVSRDEDAEPLALVFVKLAVLVGFGIAATTAIGFAFGTVVARAFTGFAG